MAAVAVILPVGVAQGVSGGSPAPEGSWGFVAKVNVGGSRGCTGALVAPQWVVTAASCFATDAKPVATGVPPLATRVSIGRTGSTAMPGVWVIPHPSQNVALVKLQFRVTTVQPVSVSGTPAGVGETVRAAGFGRTSADWVADVVQETTGVVGSADGAMFSWTGQSPTVATACKGDAGGPVLRTGAQPELVGLSIAADQGRCLAEPPGEAATTEAVRLDGLKSWITQNTPEPAANFQAFHHSSTGIGGYTLDSTVDQIVPFDYDGSGKLDHLLLYRPGSRNVFIVKRGADNSYTPVFDSSTGIGGYDLKSTADRIIAYDYEGTGKLDHLLVYRPGSKIAYVVKHGTGNTFTTVFSSFTGIGGYTLTDARDQVIAFDYLHTGKLDHLLFYRPGTGTASILKRSGDTFTAVFTSTTGIGTYDLKRDTDRIVAYDYEGTGKLDHLVLYRPGLGIVFIVKHGTGTDFTPVFRSSSGIGGYDLADVRDQILAYDHAHTGRLDHLVLYRPGTGSIFIVKRSSPSTFAAVFHSGSGIGGYNLQSSSDRIVAYDHDHAGTPNYLVPYRPGGKTVWIVGRKPGTPAAPPVSVQPVSGPRSIVEDFRYPDAAAIFAETKVKLLSGDGHIVLADCSTPPVDHVSVIVVWSTEPIGPGLGGQVCFKVRGPIGRLDLEVPGVYEIRGDGRQAGYGHRLTAVVTPAGGPPATVVINPSGSTPVGIGVNPDNPPATLLQLRVPA